MKLKKQSRIQNQHIRYSHIRTLKIRTFIITLSYLFICSLSFAQVKDDGFPSPDAAALGKYADYPVGYFTGVPAINIPLYTLKDGVATLPISLSYHASGIRVSEIASWVGLGWVLNAGGVIVRTVRGTPDEGTKNIDTKKYIWAPRGYYKDQGLSTMSLLGTNALKATLDKIKSNNLMDGESDLYAINVDGFAGKFIFDEKRNPTFLSKSDFKIAVDYSGDTFQKWTLTAPNGVKYIFGENSAQEINTIYAPTIDPDEKAPKSWYLTKMIYPNSLDTIYFEYITEAYSYRMLGSEFINNKNISASLSIQYDDPKIIRYYTQAIRLSKIKTKNFEVVFIASDDVRKDFESTLYDGAHNLTKIQIKNTTTNILLDQIKFNYDYFQSTTAGSPQLKSYDVDDTKRLKLLSVQKGLDSIALQIPPYTFEYYENVKLPRRLSYDQDHWGYANNTGGNNIMFTPFPKLDYKMGTLLTLPAGSKANRNPNGLYTGAFTLKKIKDPLGITTTFEFDPNIIVRDSINGDTIGGGIRIKRIIVDSLSKQYVRHFDYSTDSKRSSGVIFKKPTYWCEVVNEYKPVTTDPFGLPLKYAGDAGASLSIDLKFSQSPTSLQDYQGYSVGYKQVKELFGENAENGYTVYTFQASNHPSSTTRIKSSNYAPAGVPNNKFNEIAPENLTYYDSSVQGKFFPFEPTQVDLSNGLLLKKEIFNNHNQLLVSNVFNYEKKYDETQWLRGFICAPIIYASPFDTTKTILYYPLTYYKYHIGTARLLSQKTTVIDTLTGKNAITETKYAYESPNHLQSTRQTTINNGIDSSENVIRYSFDFDSTAISGGVINEMKRQNILSPLRVETWENGSLSNCSSTEYAKNTVGTKTTLVPIKTYVLKTKKNLSSADAGFTKAFSPTTANLNGSSALMKLQGVYSYNNAGLLQQQGKVGDVLASYIWDYNNTIPIAVVSNAAPVDIAYTSFEADGTGGWTVTAADRVTTDAFTGNKCYDLSKGNITKASLNSSKTYLVTYWAKTGASVSVTGTVQIIQGATQNNWTLWTKKITGATSLTISGNGTIDELRLYPDQAQMKSSTYTPGIGLTSGTDENNNINLYEYDMLNRLAIVRDGYRNVLKTYCYNYAGAPISCDGTASYSNVAVSKAFNKQCSPGSVGSSIVYTIPANKYQSVISQLDADSKARMDIIKNGQAYANNTGTCSTLYAQLSYENVNSDGRTYTYADVMVRFYADSACIIPVSVDNLPLAVQAIYNDGVGGSNTMEYDLVVNGSYVCVENGAQLMNEVELTDQGTPSGNYVTVTADYSLKFNNYYTIRP